MGLDTCLWLLITFEKICLGLSPLLLHELYVVSQVYISLGVFLLTVVSFWDLRNHNDTQYVE